MLRHRSYREATAIALLLVSQFLLIQQVFMKFLPITDGWYLGIAQAAKNQLLYKEISFPFPIGTYFFEGVLPNFFNNPIVAEQYIHSICWLILSVSFYSIMRFIFSRRVSLVVSITTLTFYFSQPGNIISGYFELMYMFYFLGWGFLLWSSCKYLRYRFFLLFAGSLFLATSVTIKQTAFLPVVSSIVFYLWWTWRNEKNHFAKIASVITIGMSGPIFAVLIWTVRKGVLFEMLENLSGGGKDPGGLSVFYTFGSNILPSNFPLIIFLTFALMIVPYFELEAIWQKIILISAIWILFLQLSGVAILSNWNFSAISGYLFLLNTVLLFSFIGNLNSKHPLVTPENFRFKFLDSFLLAALGFVPLAVSALYLYSPSGINSPRLSAWFAEMGRYVSNNLLVCGLASLAFLYSSKKFQNAPPFLDHSKSRFNFFSNFLIISTFTFYLMNSFAGGPGVETFALNIAFVLGVFLCIVHFYFDRRVFLFCTLGFFIPWNIAASAMQIQNPYSWYEVNEQPLNSERLSPKAPRLSSFSLSTTSASDYGLLYDGVLAAQDLSGGRSTEVFFGSRNLGLATMFDVDVYPIRCPILWWDICPESHALESFDQLKSRPPQIVVWTFESDNTIASNENGWRKESKSALSNIQSWLLKEIGFGRYRVIANTHQKLDIPNNLQILTRVLVRTL
jgi:hypothetical protein